MMGSIQEAGGEQTPLHPSGARNGFSNLFRRIFNFPGTNENTSTQNAGIHGMSLWVATVFIVGEMAGSGVLALPQALAGTGWIGVLIIGVCCVNACYCGIHLGRCWLILEERWEEYQGKVRYPYPAIGERAFGKWMKHVVSFCVDLTLFGASTVYLLLCAGLIGNLLYQSIGLSFCNWILILGAVLCPLTFFGTPAEFWQAAVMALVTTALACILIVISAASDHSVEHVAYKNPTSSQFFLAFGTILFAFGGASTFPTFQNDMKDKTQFPKAAVFGFIGLFSLYIPVALVGYYMYGSDVEASILDSVPQSASKTAVQVLLAIHFLFAFVIVFNPLAQEMEELFKLPHAFGWRRCLMRTGIMMLIVFMGESIPHFGKILSLVGGSTVTLMTFVFPPLFYMRLCSQQPPPTQSRLSFSNPSVPKEWPKHEISLHKRVYFIEIIGLGILGGAVSTYSALKDIADPAAFTPPCYINATAAGS